MTYYPAITSKPKNLFESSLKSKSLVMLEYLPQKKKRFWLQKKFIIFCKRINLHFMYFWTQHLTLTRIFLNFSCPCMYWCLLQSHNETYGLWDKHFGEMSVIIYSKRLQNVTIVIVNYFTSKITTIIMIKMEPNQSH